MNSRKLFPKTKFNWRAAPLLIYYGQGQYEKALNAELVRQDCSTVGEILMRYCDSGPKGQPATWQNGIDYLRLRDGRLIELSDIRDAPFGIQPNDSRTG